MGFKVICIDLDGTVLTTQKEITAATLQSLRQAQDRGIHVVISTGRTYADAEYYANQIGLDGPMITSNGAFVKAKNDSEVINQSLLGEALAGNLLDLCFRYHVTPDFHTPCKVYYGNLLVPVLLKLLEWRRGYRQQTTVVTRKYMATLKQWRRMIYAEREQLVKCEIYCGNRKKIKQLRNVLAGWGRLEAVSTVAWNLEITNQGCSKGRGLEHLARRLNVLPSEIMALGDSENDLSMLEYAGLGVAMGNAAERIKQRADYVTDTNDQDGVAKAVQKFVLNG